MNAGVQLLAITAVNAARAVFGSAEVRINRAFNDGGYTITIEVANPGPMAVSSTYPPYYDMTTEFIEYETHRMVDMLTRRVVARATEAAYRGHFVGNPRGN